MTDYAKRLDELADHAHDEPKNGWSTLLYRAILIGRALLKERDTLHRIVSEVRAMEPYNDGQRRPYYDAISVDALIGLSDA